jgi:hypothetical protein
MGVTMKKEASKQTQVLDLHPNRAALSVEEG